MSNNCELCKLHTIIHLYEDSDPRWIILDCMSCIVPMVVWRLSHTMSIPIKDYCEILEIGLINRTLHQINECVMTKDLYKLHDLYLRILEKYFNKD